LHSDTHPWRGVVQDGAMTRRAALALLCLALPAAAHAPGERLPLGDGRISAAPQRGHLLACPQRGPVGGGAQAIGPWIRDGHWHPAEKPQVEGRVTWPAEIAITREGAQRVIRGNALPASPTGAFPIRPGSEAHRYDRNPNRIAERAVLLRLPVDPQPLAMPACVPMGMIGVAVNGTAIFNALDLAGRDAPAHEVQDLCAGHPERGGQYHYHDWSPCLPETGVVGWMLDGHPILGPRLPDGRWATNADLDECHGAVADYEVDGERRRGYAYRLTLEYPYTVGCFRAAPVAAPR
jgi:hypothetical protein